VDEIFIITIVIIIIAVRPIIDIITIIIIINISNSDALYRPGRIEYLAAIHRVDLAAIASRTTMNKKR
jgi:hypothetical protein